MDGDIDPFIEAYLLSGGGRAIVRTSHESRESAGGRRPAGTSCPPPPREAATRSAPRACDPFGGRFPVTHWAGPLARPLGQPRRRTSCRAAGPVSIAGRVMSHPPSRQVLLRPPPRPDRARSSSTRGPTSSATATPASPTSTSADFVGVTGDLMRTRTGELTVRSRRGRSSPSPLRPLPEKWHGLKDVETRYRQRYVDLLVNPRRARGLPAPAPPHPGPARVPRRARLPRGRDADDAADPGRRDRPGPFKTHHNALDMPLFLRIAPELHLSAWWWAASTASTRSAGSSGTRASRPSTTPSSRCWSSTRPTRTTTT